MSLLVFGKTGQVARELARRAPGADVLGRDAADLSQPEACAAMILERQPAAVINAAAWTAVDKAETERDAAFVINAQAPAAMARACAALGVPFVHISTDYVFDGSGDRPWRPDDPTGPLGVYGQSKLAGEEAVARAGGTWAVLRTSWVFSAHGVNFVKTMLRLSDTRDAISVVADQIGGPTPAGDIAAACLTIAKTLTSDPSKSGVYHFSGAPDASWADFAREVFQQARRPVAVTDIPSEAYPTPAPRPRNSRLDCSTTKTVFGIDRPDWRAGLAAVLDELAQA
ncbi:dTDP-4-dehydrorhamnose reductase [Palleronia sp. KMU-117]|uniref:dTDP-4-dehydrorhamnose reductase n=1 Tax=Palleronia sp. KMU-117 TaxID=3434108 RepID=UPI003D71F37D